MLKRILTWILILGISFLCQKVGFEQGKAFFIICIGLCLIFGTIYTIIVSVVTFEEGNLLMKMFGTMLLLMLLVGAIGVTVVAALIASKLFSISFYIAFQLISLGTCLTYDKKGNKKES